jgi:hypothetical protein
MHKVVLEQTPIEIAYLDFYGNLMVRECNWIRSSLLPRLTKNARIGITTTMESRGNAFVNVLITELRKLPSFAYLGKQLEVSRVNRGKVMSDLNGNAWEWPMMYTLLLSCICRLPMAFRFVSYMDGAQMLWIEMRHTIPTGVQARIYDLTDGVVGPLREVVADTFKLFDSEW